MSNKELLKSLGLLSDEPECLGFVSTGSYALNKIISGDYNGGVPIGGITQFTGESSTAKTVFVTHVLAEAQKKGYYTILDDIENAYNAEFAKSMGLKPDELIYSRSETIEDAFESMEAKIKAIRAEDPDTPIVIGLDSIAVAPVRKEVAAENYTQSEITGALRAKVIGGCLRKINKILREQKVCLVVINQIRSKVGVMFGSPDTMAAGGKALEYYLMVNLKTISNKTSDLIKNAEKKVVGIFGSVRCTKNKVSLPYQECEFELLFNKGLTKEHGLLNKLVEDGVVERAGAWYTLGETKFQGKTFASFLANPEKKDFDRVRSLLGNMEAESL